jgi:hypothetical protein
VTAADWWVAGLTIWSWVILAAAAGLAWRWALRTHTLYRGMRADVERGRPAAPAAEFSPEVVAAIEGDHHHHAAARPRGMRIPRPRIPRRQHPQHADMLVTPDGPEVVVLADSCVHCLQVICPRCQGCGCAIVRCECTQTAIGRGQ